MTTNRNFNLFQRTSEQNFIDDLIIESIQIHGIDVFYLPRTLQKPDSILNEDVLSKFDDYYQIEMYIKSVDGFGGDQEIFSKFGLEIKEQITFSVARSRFDRIMGTELPRPKEGDLIFVNLPMNQAIYEIKFVEHESVFYQAGELYLYDLKCELFNYSEEEINTGITEIDEIASKYDNKIEIVTGAGTGTFVEGEEIYQGADYNTATAKATIDTIIDATHITIRDIAGEFVVGTDIDGVTSLASRNLVAIDDQDIINSSGNSKNDELETIADDVIDFTEKNPFSGDDY